MNQPILLAVELTNGHFMSCRLFYPDRFTHSLLQHWHRNMFVAIQLIQLGDLHYIKGPQAIARHRDFGDDWLDHQPRFSPSWHHLKALARSLKIDTLYIQQSGEWQVHRPFDAKL